MNLINFDTELDAVIVDLDGTMVDTLGDFVFALNAMLDDLALPRVQRPVVERLVGKGSEHLIKSVLLLVKDKNQVIDSEARYGRAWDSYQHHYARINGQHAEVFPGVREGLQQIKNARLQLACLTNKPTAFALALLKSKGLDGFLR
jgi:phosphoglycolate phosphatase